MNPTATAPAADKDELIAHNPEDEMLAASPENTPVDAATLPTPKTKNPNAPLGPVMAAAKKLMVSQAPSRATTPDFLKREVKVAGFVIRPITMLTISLLTDANSELINGKPYTEIKNIFFESMKVLVLSTGTKEEAEALSVDPVALKVAIHERMDQLAPWQSGAVVSDVAKALKESTETQMKPIPPEHLKPKKGTKSKDRAPKNT